MDLCKPGDRVAIVGMYKAMPVSTQGSTSGIFRTLIVGTNLRQLTAEVTQPTFSQEDMKNIRRMIKRKDLFEVIADSLAPSIFGHDQIKKALTLQASVNTAKRALHVFFSRASRAKAKGFLGGLAREFNSS